MWKEPITLSCSNGFTLIAQDGNITIRTRKKDEVIPVSRIHTVTLKEPGALSPGKFIFTTAQAPSAGIGVGFGVIAAIGSEKSFFYSKADYPIATTMRDYILGYEKQKQAELEAARRTEQKPQQTVSQQPASTASVINEIRSLKELLDEGILTEEEFQFKKRQLLGM